MFLRQLYSSALVLVVAACSASERVAPLDGEAMLAKTPPGATDPTATFLFPIGDPALDVASDGQVSDGTNSAYANGVCGVSAKIFATEAASNSGDATLQMNNPKSKDRSCIAYPRKVTVKYADGVQTTGAVFMNVRHIQNTTYRMPVGVAELHGLAMTYETRCGGLRWMSQGADGTALGADEVFVMRLDASTWLVESQPAPNNKAYCSRTGELFNLDVRFTVKSSEALPLP